MIFTATGSKGDTTNVATYFSGTWGIGSHTLALMFISAVKATGASPGVLGGFGLTWVRGSSFPYGTSTNQGARLEMWYATTVDSGATGIGTWGATASQTGCTWQLIGVTGYNPDNPFLEVTFGSKTGATHAATLTNTTGGWVVAAHGVRANPTSITIGAWGLKIGQYATAASPPNLLMIGYGSSSAVPFAGYNTTYQVAAMSISLGRGGEWRNEITSIPASPRSPIQIAERIRQLSHFLDPVFMITGIRSLFRTISSVITPIFLLIQSITSILITFIRYCFVRVGNTISSEFGGGFLGFGPLGGGPLGGLSEGEDVNPRVFTVAQSIIAGITTYVRTIINTIVPLFSIKRISEYIRWSTITIQLSWLIKRVGEYIRKITVLLSILAIVSKVGATLRTLSLSLGLTSSVSRISEKIRQVAILLGIVFSTSRIRNLIRRVSTGINIANTIKRIGTYARTVAARVSRAIVLAQSKMGSFYRNVSMSLVPTLSVVRQILISLYIRTLSTIKNISNTPIKKHRAFDHFDGPELDGVWRDYSLAPYPHKWKISNSILMVDGTPQNLSGWYKGSCFSHNQSATICLGSSIPSYGTGWQVGIYLRAVDVEVTGLRAEYARLTATQNDLRIYAYGTYLGVGVYTGMLWSTTLGTMLGQGDILSASISDNDVKMYVNGELAGTTIWNVFQTYVGSPGWFILNYTNLVPYTDGFLGIDWWSAEPVIWSSAKFFASPKSYLSLLLSLMRAQITRVRNILISELRKNFALSRIGEFIRKFTVSLRAVLSISRSKLAIRTVTDSLVKIFALSRMGQYTRYILTSLIPRILSDWVSSAEKKWMKWKMMLFQRDKFKESGKESGIYKTDTKEQDRYKT